MRGFLFFCQVAGAAAVLGLGTQAALAQTEARRSAETLDQRTKAPSEGSEKEGLSDSAVRVMTSFAWSLVPEEAADADGKPVKLDKSDPNKFFIPLDDARRVIRVATRTAYASVCELPDLERQNYQTLMLDETRRDWSDEQMIFIDTLHRFTALYLTGNVKITEEEEEEEGEGGTAQGDGQQDGFSAKRPTCQEGQKEKVKAAIETYVRSAAAAAAAQPKRPSGEAAPAASGAGEAPARSEARPVTTVPKKAPLAGSD